MSFPEKNYTHGKYRVYFDPFIAGTKTKTGQRYFGNTPELNMTVESENLDHFDSDNGVRVKDDSMLLELNRTGSFVTDHISPPNLAAFFLGADSVLTQTSAASQTFAINDVKKGRRYQIGSTSALPQGVKGITNVVVTSVPPGTTYAAGTDYTVDLDTGGLVILSTGTIPEDGDISVAYDRSATTYNKVVTADNAELYGALYFESNNPKGSKIDFYIPYALLRPDGDFELKPDEWQQLPFSFEALKLDDATPTIIMTGRPGADV